MSKGILCGCGHHPSQHAPGKHGPGLCLECECVNYLPGDDTAIPDVIGEIEGWRAWKIVGPSRFPRLGSVTHEGTIWPAKEWTEADCGGEPTCKRSSDGEVPGESCSCGLYAARTREHLVQLGYNAYGTDFAQDPKVVIGKVGLVGKVIPGTQGWRASKGRIVELYVPTEFWKLAPELEKAYHCRAVTDNTWRKEPGRYGIVPRGSEFVVVDKFDKRTLGRVATRAEARLLIDAAGGESVYNADSSIEGED